MSEADEPVAWMITYYRKDGDMHTHRMVYTHNAIGDYRELYPDATSTPLYASPPASAVHEWIPVSERLPPDSKPVLIQAFEGDSDWQDVAWYSGTAWQSNWSRRRYDDAEKVTHWMPITPLPAGKP